MPTANVNGASIYYEVHGEGTALVLSHPGFTSAESWRPILPSLAKNYRVVVYDRRGCGRSVADGGIESSDVWLQDLVALAGHLGIGEAYFGGSSYGAMLTLELLLAHPEMVRAALLLSGTTQYFGPRSANAVPFPDRRNRLAEISCPVLIMQGELDARFPPDTGEEAHRAIPGSQLVIVKNAGHGFHLEVPEFTSETILEFLRRVEADPHGSR